MKYKTFGKLTKLEQLELRNAWKEGKIIEFYAPIEKEWCVISFPGFYVDLKYRTVSPKPTRQTLHRKKS